MTTFAQFLDSAASVALTSADLDALKQRRSPRVVVARGSHMRTKQALLDEVSAALQFPLDFGNNWDALADCLGDLDWLGGPGAVVLGIAQAPQILADDPAALQTLAAILTARAPHVLLGVADPAHAAGVRAAWQRAGAPVVPLT